MLFKATLLVLIILTGSFIPVNHEISWYSELNKKAPVQMPSVLLNNQSATIPVNDLAQRHVVSINAGTSFSTEFNNMLRNYTDISSIDLQNLGGLNQLSSYNTLVVQVTSESLLNPATLNFLLEAQKSKEVIVAGFGNPAALAALDLLNSPVIWNVDQNAAAAEHTARIIFGGEAAGARLSQTVSAKYISGSGYTTQKTRIRYANREELEFSSSKLSRIDDIVNDAIRQHATPSAVVMVIKDGEVIFDKAYGSHTYDGDVETKVDDIYDLASVTKVAATTMAAMKLYDEQKLDLNASLGTYLDDVRNTNKNDIPVKDVLLHQAGFVNLDFYSYLKPQDHSLDSSDLYSVKLADHYFLRNNYYHDVMWQKMLSTPLPTRGEYVYSDISMYMMKEIIEHQTQESLDKYVSEQFYSTLGMRTAGFNPIHRFNKDQIVPTERDTYFRKTLLQGYVQDPGASMANGVAGHAGLFASANDLAILNQMLLNGGSYGGISFFKPETVKLFTSSQSSVSRRGLGFDRGNGTGYPSTLASPDSFGHTGYTGTCVWVDPRENLVYIFLSNRVYPSASNKLNSLRVRPRIQDAIYEAIAVSKQNLASVE
jgi:CubicO group peptidase (beta-lactamase class C family)